MDQIEKKLDDLFTKTISVKLPESGKKVLVKVLPWLALVGGILSLFGAWGMYQLTTYTNNLVNVTNELSRDYYYSDVAVEQASGLIWVSIVGILVQAIMLLAAFSPLKAGKKLGWNLVYWTSLINIAFAILYIFVDFDFFALVFSLIASAVGLYLLFQIRSSYLGGSASSSKSSK
jgi:hypothetical protein